MEMLEVLDENGNPTGEILSKAEVNKRNLLHNEIVVFLVNDKKQVLLQKRAATKKLGPNMWALPAGHVQAGESVEDCAVREIEEEIGLKLSKDDLKHFKDKVIAINPVHSHVMYFFYAETNLKEEEFVLQEEEVAAVKWWDIDEFLERQKNGDPYIVYEKPVRDLFLELKAYVGK